MEHDRNLIQLLALFAESLLLNFWGRHSLGLCVGCAVRFVVLISGQILTWAVGLSS